MSDKKKSDPFRGEGVSGTPRTKRELFVVCPTCQAKIVLWPPPEGPQAVKSEQP